MQITVIDLLFGFIVLLITIFYWIRYLTRSVGSGEFLSSCSDKKSIPLVYRIRNHGFHVVVFYGTQSGTAEQFAGDLNCTLYSHGLKCVTINLIDFDALELPDLCCLPNIVTIFVISTYGEGDPPEGAQHFVDWLEQTNTRLTGLRYTVFGLGNSTYTFYNACGKLIDRSLHKHGAKRFHAFGMGDETDNTECAFLDWQTQLIDHLLAHFSMDVKPSAQICLPRLYKTVPVNHSFLKKTRLFMGEPEILGSYGQQLPPFNASNPFLAPVRVNQELYLSGSRSCRHIELDLTGSNLSYEAGDHVAVLPQNPSSLVERLGALLSIDLDRPIDFHAIDPLNPRQKPFPCPCTYRTAFTYYLDITGPPRMMFFRTASQYANNMEEAERLMLLGNNTPQGREYYAKWVIQERRGVVHVLQEFSSLRIPAEVLLERLARLKVRLYSISSSPRVYPRGIHITSSVVNEPTPTGRCFKGLVSSWLADLTPTRVKSDGDCTPVRVPIYVRSSRFHLPKSVKIPIIMIAAGTGLAPFRAFIQDRCHQVTEKVTSGPMMLFFGCRRMSEDYIYAKELEAVQSTGLLRLFVAFSRDAHHGSKVYVQDKVREVSSEIWKLLDQLHAHVYVCGSAKTMARDVHSCLVELVASHGKLPVKSAENYLSQLRTEGRYHLDVWS